MRMRGGNSSAGSALPGFSLVSTASGLNTADRMGWSLWAGPDTDSRGGLPLENRSA